jgi:hypothetical protein
MAAPFTRDYCPHCEVETKQRLLGWASDAPEGEDQLLTICYVCKTVLTHGDAGVIASRPATEEERAAVPAPVVWSDEEKAWWRENLRQGQADLRAWFDSGCPGLTAEVEASLGPGTLERLKQFLHLSEGLERIIPEDNDEQYRSTK